MTEELSKYVSVLDFLGQAITTNTNFHKIPVYYDMVELIADDMPTTAIVLQGKPYELDDSQCNYERQLDVIIIHNTNHPRSITLRLTKYGEDMKDTIEEVLQASNDFEMTFLQGSEIRATRNNREDSESYKGSKTLYSSLIVLSYLLRY